MIEGQEEGGHIGYAIAFARPCAFSVPCTLTMGSSQRQHRLGAPILRLSSFVPRNVVSYSRPGCRILLFV